MSAGVEVDLATVRYHSSQPWPFPQSLMLGFTARAAPAPPATSRVDALGVRPAVLAPVRCRLQLQIAVFLPSSVARATSSRA